MNSYVRIPEQSPVSVETAPQPRPEFVGKTSSRVRVYTPSGVLEGSHHHPEGVRLSDMLRNQASTEKYMMLTDCQMQHADGSSLTVAFVLVNTQHASIIMPLDEQ